MSAPAREADETPEWERLADQYRREGVTEDMLALSAAQRAMVVIELVGVTGFSGKHSGMGAVSREFDITRQNSSVQRVQYVVGHGIPELLELMWDGSLTVAAAERTSRLTPEAQVEITRGIRRGVKPRSLVPGTRDNRPRKTNRPSKHGHKPQAVTLKSVADMFRVATDYTLSTVTSLDESITYELAAELQETYRKTASELTRVNKLLKERTER